MITGRVEQGIVRPGEEVIFLPTHQPSTPCTGKVFTVEMHHCKIEDAKPGDNVGLNIKGDILNIFYTRNEWRRCEKYTRNECEKNQD